MAMNRRDFIKSCSLMAVAGLLFGCRKNALSELSDVLSGSSDVKKFEDEVRLAMSMSRKDLDLVPVPFPKELPVRGKMGRNRFGMVIDLNACDGCGKCILACNKENNVPLVPDEDAARGRFMHWIEMRGNAPFMCAHCGNAPCEKVCPTGAASHSEDGLSTMMYKRCTGSRFCGANCPVQARKFNFHDSKALGLSRVFNSKVPTRDKGVMEKCSLCLHRLQDDRLRFKTEQAVSLKAEEWRGRGVKTACAEACPKKAIIFGNWLDKESPLVKAVAGRTLYAPKSLAGFDPSVLFIMERR